MSTSLETLSAGEERQNLDRAGWLVFGFVLIATVVASVAFVTIGLPGIALFAFPALLVAVWVLRSPVVGFFALFGAALVISVQPLGYGDSITDSIPFFLNLSDGSSLNVSGLGITPAEILMVITFVGLVSLDRATYKRLPAGPLMVPYLVLGCAVLIGEVNGLAHGGDFKKSLWELRPQVYGLALFVLATQLIRSRSQLKVLLAILLVAEIFKGGVGVFRYYVTLGGQVGGTVAIQSHEESYLLGLFITAVVIGLMWFRRPLIALLVAATPIVLVAILVNHRRAATGALGLEVVTVMVFAYILEPRFRGWLFKVGVLMVVLGAVFTVAFWNQQSGTAAELIRPIKSVIQPTARDLSSDLYRVAETHNLKATFRTSPLIGIGFGRPYYIYYPQTGVAQYDPLWNIIPHNTVLWIPMRMGVIGLIAFWCLISMAIIEAIWTARVVHDKLIRGAVVFALAAIFGELFSGYYDVGLENYRNLIVLGVLLAIINRAGHLARDEQASAQQVATVGNRPITRPVESGATGAFRRQRT